MSAGINNKKEFERVHKLKKPLLEVIIKERDSKQYSIKIKDELLRNKIYNFITETTSTNINSILLALDYLGYDLVPVKRKK